MGDVTVENGIVEMKVNSDPQSLTLLQNKSCPKLQIIHSLVGKVDTVKLYSLKVTTLLEKEELEVMKFLVLILKGFSSCL